MPIKVQSGLPARETLERENVFTMDENRAMHQDIRPIEVGILNLMPLKEETELQILRELSNTPLQVDVTFVKTGSHESRNTSSSHLNKFYHIPDLRKTVEEDIGTCFPLSEIKSWDIKKAMMGAVNCSITLKNGSFLKLQLPKLGGLGGGMPRHKEYREKIIECLEALSA